MLLAAGALARQGRLSLPIAIAVGIGATLLADVAWYRFGRSRGNQALGLVTRIALDPDSAVRRAKERFAAHRLRMLVIAKFLPGMNPLAAGLAGTFRVDPVAFLAYEALGALLWSGVWIVGGYLAADLLGALAAQVAQVGKPALLLVSTALAAWLAFKWARRRWFLRHLRTARITPEELKRQLDAAEPIVLVDVRTNLDVEHTPYKIPGALRRPPGDLGYGKVPYRPEDTIVFYCSEPNEGTSARIAMLGYKKGYRRVHPLSGGLASWQEKGFAVEPVDAGWTTRPG